ncbi:uncharacterized protein SPSK_02284 [Sporothrix schenckii 1099-18]|uniref:Zn(2)-C6 fungal-type domain-containing protein n=1 Tax=Sporothrix schenckii 1099-18 TaxID=1397361 RepID=A0A0F2M8S2_SPOSC|nr:uncharacterized protein SPSK_02284 [Sporothrix schenckii 1099-18]KJR86098.1 hypothetical protein SPSK_02284 [Sporothrix schenckii 1099-18]
MGHAAQTPVSDFSEASSFCCGGGGPRKRVRTESTGSTLSTHAESAAQAVCRPTHGNPPPPTIPISNPTVQTNYPKKRVSVACEVCRTRKTRCDAGRPACSFCAQIGAQCIYRTVEPPEEKRAAAATRRDVNVSGHTAAAADTGEVLSRLHRIEGLLNEIHNRQEDSIQAAVHVQASTSPSARIVPQSTDTAATVVTTADTTYSPSYDHVPRLPLRTQPRVGSLSFEGIARLDGHPCPPALIPMARIGSDDDIETEFLQGEALMAGPASPSADGSGNSDAGTDADFDMRNLPAWLNVTPRRCWQLQQIFYRDVLPWCPIIDQQVCSAMVTRTVESRFHPDHVDTSLTLLVLALGAFAEGHQHREDDARVFPGRAYFRAACALVDSPRQAAFRNTVAHVQCHIMMAFYLLYAIRPIQAFELIRRASEKVILLLQRPRRSSHPVAGMLDTLPDTTADPSYQALCRSYWACYLIEHELQAYVSYSANLLRDFEDVVPLPMSDYEEPGIYWFLSEIALRRIFARQRGGRGWNGHTLFEPVVAGEIALQMAQWHSNLPAPVKFDLDEVASSEATGHGNTPLGTGTGSGMGLGMGLGMGPGVDTMDVRPLLDPIKVFLRAQYYAVHAALYWQYVVQMLSQQQHGQSDQRTVEAAALSLRYSVVHVFAVESLLQGRHLLLVPNLVGLLCNACFLLCSYAEPGLEAIQHPRAREAIVMAVRCIQAWQANPVVQTYVTKVEQLMALKGIALA